MGETITSRRAALKDLRIPSPAHGARKDAQQPRQSSQEQNAAGILDVEKGIHAGLWLDKYIANLEQYRASSQSEGMGSPQQKLVHEVASLGVPEAYKLFYARWLQTLEEAGAGERYMRKFTTRSRLVVGLGNEGVLETSVALHRTYGMPYIPGSALKGLAASYARLMAGEEWQQGSYAYNVVFGDTENAGYIIFFDALYIPGSACQNSPAQSNSQPDCPLHPDIITVHHPNYYQEKKDEKGKRVPPADWDSPIPIPFLSATGNYLIALAAPDLDEKNRGPWIEKTFDLLAEALLILGIGAKTSSGYGRMEVAEKRSQTKKVASIKTPLLDLPTLQVGQQITGIVIKSDQRATLQNFLGKEEHNQFLTYRDPSGKEYSSEQVVIVVSGQAASWNAGDQRNCRVLRIEKLDNRLFVFCEAVVSKFANKKKKR